MESKRKASWFATLRCDGRLFALLALVLLTVQALQPLAAARASESTGHLIICTALGGDPSPDGAPIRHDGCAECIAGACGFGSPAGKAVAASLPAWQPVVAHAPARFPSREAEPAFRLDAGAPPGIRAPPFAA